MTKQQFQTLLNRGIKLDNFRPGTGIGRFDVHLARTLMTVTLKLSFEFLTMKQYQVQEGEAVADDEPDGPTWSAEDKRDYVERFKLIIERTWSRQYKFVCKQQDWTDITFAVDVKVRTCAKGLGHYNVRVVKAGASDFRAMIAHADLWDGKFCDSDILPQVNATRDQAYGHFVMAWMQKEIKNTECDYLPFASGKADLSPQVKARLTSFATKARRHLSKEAIDAGVAIWVYSQTDSADKWVRASSRTRAIGAYLKSQLRPFDGAIKHVSKFSAQPWIAKPMKDNLDLRSGASKEDIGARNFAGGMLLVKTGLQNSAIPLSDSPKIPRDYIVVAHEFGHMLGLPDEYFGVQCNALKNAIEQRQDLISSVKVVVGNDRVKAQHEGMATLVQRAHLPAPIMGTTSIVTDSIMYAGNKVLPAHYVTFFEALCNCSHTFVAPNGWSVHVDNPNNLVHAHLHR